jgi:UDP:flavonoid glycosyltransferase YjiC (YdhE family)
MRILLFLVGVGAGNTTRTLALLDALRRRAPDLDIHVAAQGRAAALLEGIVPVHRAESFSPARIITSNLSFPLRFLQNRAAAARLLDRLKPDIAVADSDFYCLGPAKRRGVRLVSINSSAATVAALKRMGTPPGCRFSARVIERTDAWLQHRYPDQVICPVLVRESGLPKKFHQIPPIVRAGFEPCADPGEIGDDVAVVTGGSGIGTAEIDLRAVEAPVVTVGSTLSLVPAHARQCGFTLDVVEVMRRARVLVVQGGFSSVSEAVALRRPTVVVPIARHAEQHVNARLFEELGLGLASPGPAAGATVNALLERLGEFEARCREHSVTVDGADEAAEALLPAK